MSTQLTRVDPLSGSGWQQRLKAGASPSVFHCAEWTRALSDSYGYRAHFLEWREGGEAVGLLPFMEVDSLLTGRRGVSLPFSDRCDPILREGIDRQALFSAAVDYAERRRWRYLDFHGGRNLLDDVLPSTTFVGHRLGLTTDSSGQRSHVHASTRRNIKKAVRLGVETDIGVTPQALEELYALHCLTRRRHRLPAQPLRFFRAIHRHILSSGMGHIVRSMYRGRTVGAAMFFHIGDQALFKFGASDLRYQHLRMNDLVLWRAIEWAAIRGYQALDFGRTDRRNRGLRQFKAGWGAEEYPIRYYRYDLKDKVFLEAASNRRDAVMASTFGRMPIPIARLVGALFYRHFG